MHLQDDGPELLRRQELLVLRMERGRPMAPLPMLGAARVAAARSPCRGALGERVLVLRGGLPAFLCAAWRASRPRALAELIFLASSQNLGLGQTRRGSPTMLALALFIALARPTRGRCWSQPAG